MYKTISKIKTSILKMKRKILDTEIGAQLTAPTADRTPWSLLLPEHARDVVADGMNADDDSPNAGQGCTRQVIVLDCIRGHEHKNQWDEVESTVTHLEPPTIKITWIRYNVKYY